MWQHLVVLQYLDALCSGVGGLAGSAAGSAGNMSDGTTGGLADGSWATIGSLEPADVMRGASFDRDISRLIGSKLGKCSKQDILAACEKLGGQILEGGKADVSAVFRFLPRYPMLLNLWLADDEFPASGKVLINSGAGLALGLEAAGTIAVYLVDELCSAAAK